MKIAEEDIRLLVQLHRLTLEGQLIWEKDRITTRLSTPGTLTSAVYVAHWEDMTFRLYRIEGQHCIERPGGYTELVSELDIVLEVLDADGDSIQEIKNGSILFRLFDSVRSIVSGFKQRVAKFMKEDVSHAH
jgi:hypothetical protein